LAKRTYLQAAIKGEAIIHQAKPSHGLTFWARVQAPLPFGFGRQIRHTLMRFPPERFCLWEGQQGQGSATRYKRRR
jgi:hypothetical protein